MTNKLTEPGDERFVCTDRIWCLLKPTNLKRISKQVREFPTSLHVIRNMDRKPRWISLYIGVSNYD